MQQEKVLHPLKWACKRTRKKNHLQNPKIKKIHPMPECYIPNISKMFGKKSAVAFQP